MRVSLSLIVVTLTAGCPVYDVPDDDDAGEGEGEGEGEGDGAVDGEWSEAAALDEPRQEIAVVALGNEAVIIGGFTSGAIVPRVDAYDPVADSWRALPDFPTPLHHANAVVVDGALFVTGFLFGGDFQRDGRVFELDIATNAWVPGALTPAGTERGASGVAAHDVNVYVFGGTAAGGSSTLVSRYDTAGDVWTEMPPLPVALDHLGAGTIGDTIFVVGGRSNGIANHTTTLLAFDPLALSYDERAPMPTSRAGFAVTVHDGYLYVFGGEGNVGVAGGVFVESERYDPSTDTWERLENMRTPRHGNGAAGVGDVIVVPGGATTQGFGAVTTVDVFAPPP